MIYEIAWKRLSFKKQTIRYVIASEDFQEYNLARTFISTRNGFEENTDSKQCEDIKHKTESNKWTSLPIE